MWKAASTWSRLRLRPHLFTTLVIAIGLLAPAAAGGHRLSGGQAPAAPNGLVVVGASTSTISLSWKASNGAVDYEVRTRVRHRGSSSTRYRQRVARTTGTRITVDSLSCGTPFTLGVAARGYRTRSSESRIVASTRACASPAPAAPAPSGDSQAPSAPTGLTSMGSTPVSVSVSWAPSTDNVAVAGYGLYLNGALFSTTTGTSFVFGSLDCGARPRLGVDAFDAVGNRSARTVATIPTQACTTPPTSCSKVAFPGQGTAQALLASLSSGQVGCLRGGTYTASGSYVLDFSKSSVMITSYPSERALLIGVMVVRSGASGSRLAGVAVEGTGGSTGQTNTIQVLGAADFVIEDSDITNAWRGRSCVVLGDGSAGVAVRPVIRRNRFHECGNLANGNKDHAIYAANVVDAKITENLFWNSAAYALHLYPNAQRTVFAHNVVDGGSPSVTGGVILGGDSGAASSGNIVEYNVISYSTRYNIESWWGGAVGSGNVARSNCVFGGGLGDIDATNGFASQNNLVAQPLFVSRAGRDYHLRADSPCLAVVGYDTAARARLAQLGSSAAWTFSTALAATGATGRGRPFEDDGGNSTLRPSGLRDEQGRQALRRSFRGRIPDRARDRAPRPPDRVRLTSLILRRSRVR